jgi:endonuclease/exonuclease/phosphatase family metal-dependent hydrolase
VGVGRDDGGEGGEYAAILYRTDRLELLDSGTFWFSDTPTVPGSTGWGNTIPRICTWGRFRDRLDDREFYHFNVHLDHASQPSRERSAALLAEQVNDPPTRAPVLVTGDFNAGEQNPAMTTLYDSGLSDSYRHLHPDAADAGTFNDFVGARDGEKIDAILVGSGWVVEEADIVHTSRDGRYPSDHFPVTAVLARR